LSNEVVLKLTNGDMLMGEYKGIGTDAIMIKDPILLSVVHVQQGASTIEKTVTSPYCIFTAEDTFHFDARHIVFLKPLHPKMVDQYRQLVQEFNNDNQQPVQDNLSNLVPPTDMLQ